MPENKKTADKNMALAAGSVFKMVDVIEYQTGSVVSRTLIDKPAGTVTLFAFARGQGLSEHTAPFDALVYLLDGEAKISISGSEYILTEGEMIIMPANKPHALKAEKQFKMILVMVKS